MTTDADAKVENARQHIIAAIEDLSEVVVDRIWGSEQFRVDYRQKLLKCMNDLIQMREDLGD